MGSGLTPLGRAGRVAHARAVAWRTHAAVAALTALAVLAVGGCASSTHDEGAYYTVRAGDNLYRIGKRFGVHHDVIKRQNGIRDVTQMRVGTRLFIPGKSASGNGSSVQVATSSTRAKPSTHRAKARKESNLAFRWPLKGRLSSSFGRRNGRPHEGIDVAAPKGTSVRAAESGKVVYAGRLGAYGRTVILKHTGSYRSVYAHASKTLVRKGQFVDQGDKIATVGATGRATGPHLHFEIRRRESPRDPMLYLP